MGARAGSIPAARRGLSFEPQFASDQNGSNPLRPRTGQRGSKVPEVPAPRAGISPRPQPQLHVPQNFPRALGSLSLLGFLGCVPLGAQIWMHALCVLSTCPKF